MTGPAVDAPGYWIHETSGALSAEHVATLRAYLRQWIAAPAWRGSVVDSLRRSVDGLTSRAAIKAWLELADIAGVDPL